MRTLGVHGAGDVLYLSVADENGIADEGPYTFEDPAGLAAARRLPTLRDEAQKIVNSLGVERVRILNPESNYKTTITSVHTRIALETVLALGSAEAGVDCDRLSRPAVRSLLSLPKKGELVSLVDQVTEKVGPHWSPRKRDLAALVAVAAQRQE